MTIVKSIFNKIQNSVLATLKIKLETKGPLATIIENDDPKYYQLRAIEAIRSALTDAQNASDNRMLAMKLLLLTEIRSAAAKQQVLKTSQGTGSENPGSNS